MLWLASRSPRRAQLLRDAGYAVSTAIPAINDGDLQHTDAPAEHWVMSLAYLKARAAADIIHPSADAARRGIILGADTVCAAGRTILGQPRDVEDARRMLRLLSGREHRTLTGVCFLQLRSPTSARLIDFDAAIVRIGPLDDDHIESYLASGEWRGKAGAYNLSERIHAGWPIACAGDPATVMGLPMQRLHLWLRRATEMLPRA